MELKRDLAKVEKEISRLEKQEQEQSTVDVVEIVDDAEYVRSACELFEGLEECDAKIESVDVVNSCWKIISRSLVWAQRNDPRQGTVDRISNMMKHLIAGEDDVKDVEKATRLVELVHDRIKVFVERALISGIMNTKDNYPKAGELIPVEYVVGIMKGCVRQDVVSKEGVLESFKSCWTTFWLYLWVLLEKPQSPGMKGGDKGW